MSRRISDGGNTHARARGAKPAHGFTALELMLVIAVLALLAGVVLPRGKDAEAARRTRAATEVQSLAQALLTFESTVGAWPTLDAAGRSNRVRVLLSGASLPATNPWAAGHTYWTWTAAGLADLLHNHLITNSPAGQRNRRYPTSGRTAWLGSYVDSCPLDPWGRPYVANVLASYSTGANYRRLFVLSAGPDGRFQTAATALAGSTPAGDDIGCLVWER